MKINKQNIGWIISVILILVILSYAGFLFLNSQVEEGIGEGILIGQEQIIIKINQDATIPIISQEGEEFHIDWVGIQEICGSVK